MSKTKLNYKEGDWFVVPLLTGGYAVGLVARRNNKGIVLGYFFGPKYETMPTQHDLNIDKKPEDSILITLFGDLGFIEGTWKTIMSSENWNRNKWPIPYFVRTDCMSEKTKLIEYSDELVESKNMPCDKECSSKYPKDGLAGSGAIEIMLSKLFAQ